MLLDMEKCLTVAVHRAGDCQWGEYRRCDSRVWWPWYVLSFILSVECTPRLSFRFRVVIVRGWALWDIVYVFRNLQNDHLAFSHDKFALAWWVSARRGGSYIVWARPRNKPVQAWQHCQISNCLSVNKSCNQFAEGTPFAGGVFKLRLSLDGDYPMTPPKGEPSSVKLSLTWISYSAVAGLLQKIDAFVSLPMAVQWLCTLKGMPAADSWVKLTCAEPCQCETHVKEECICCRYVPHQASQTWLFPRAIDHSYSSTYVCRSLSHKDLPPKYLQDWRGLRQCA